MLIRALDPAASWTYWHTAAGGNRGSARTTQVVPSVSHIPSNTPSQDIVSWDTRGTWHSTPKQSCYANNRRRSLWVQPWIPVTDGYDFDDPAHMAQIIQRFRYEHDNCRAMLAPTNIREHTHSEAHARDMDSILTALGHDQMRFFGFSYGTNLAVYYATLFPHKVGRTLAEANVDAVANHEGDHFASLADADRNRAYLYGRCAADPECPLHEATPSAVGERIDRLLEDLRHRPRLEYRRQDPVLYTEAVARFDLDTVFRDIHIADWTLQKLAAMEAGD